MLTGKVGNGHFRAYIYGFTGGIRSAIVGSSEANSVSSVLLIGVGWVFKSAKTSISKVPEIAGGMGRCAGKAYGGKRIRITKAGLRSVDAYAHCLAECIGIAIVGYHQAYIVASGFLVGMIGVDTIAGITIAKVPGVGSRMLSR